MIETKNLTKKFGDLTVFQDIDLIIGGHSHTVQPFEIYKGKHIFYSLGNFCFDDIVHENETFQIGRFRKRKTKIL